MTDKYSDLKKAAEAALAVEDLDEVDADEYQDTWDRFDALITPHTVLALLADLDEAQLELSGVETAKKDLAEVLGCADEPRWKWLYCNASELVRKNEKLKAEAESLRKDAERYRWLRDYHIGDDPESINLEPAGRRGLGQAIDAAMKKEPQS